MVEALRCRLRVVDRNAEAVERDGQGRMFELGAELGLDEAERGVELGDAVELLVARAGELRDGR